MQKHLGLTLRELRTREAPSLAEEAVADLVYTAAQRADYLHRQFISHAESATDRLTQAVSGTVTINSLGVLQHTGTMVDILAARRDDAVEHLNEVIYAYRRAVPAVDSASAHTHQMTASAANISPLSAHPPAAATTTPSRAASRR